MGVGAVLPGAAARGAYEAGVLAYVLREVARDLPRPLRFSVACGTSAGAINACILAAFADDPAMCAERLLAAWLRLRVTDILHPEVARLIALVCGLASVHREPTAGEPALLGHRRLAELIGEQIPFNRIAEHLRAGRLDAVSVSTTHVASGRPVVFVEGREPLVQPALDSSAIMLPARLSAEHLLASAAIPFLFPAVRIGEDLYCEGGLRQNVPLAPALRLGADALLVANPHRLQQEWPLQAAAEAHERASSSPIFLLGKMLNALLLDRLDGDVGRLEQLNAVLEAGSRGCGDAFLPALNAQLGGASLRKVRMVMVRASQDIGVLAGQFVRTREFAGPVLGLVERALRALGDHLAGTEADLLSYLLFDGRFAAQLIELGRADARAHHEALCALFAEAHS